MAIWHWIMVCCLREKAGRPVRAWRLWLPAGLSGMWLRFKPEDCPAPFAADHLAANTGRHRVTHFLAPAQLQLACHAADCGAADAQVAGHLGVGAVVEVAADVSGTFQPPALDQLLQSEFASFLLHGRHAYLEHISSMCSGLHGVKLGKPGEHGFCPVDSTHGIRGYSC